MLFLFWGIGDRWVVEEGSGALWRRISGFEICGGVVGQGPLVKGALVWVLWKLYNDRVCCSGFKGMQERGLVLYVGILAAEGG
jgi:hypothetical protein